METTEYINIKREEYDRLIKQTEQLKILKKLIKSYEYISSADSTKILNAMDQESNKE